MKSSLIFTFCVSLLLMCHTDIFVHGVEQKSLLYGCSYSDTCNGNINPRWCYKRSVNVDRFNISRVSGATAGMYECCSSSILTTNGRDCCAALERGEQSTVSFNVIVRARPELVCEPSNCVADIKPNDTSLSLKGVLRPAKEGFDIQQAQPGLWKYNNQEISQNGTLPKHDDINVTIVGETRETLLLNGPGLDILNRTEFSFEIDIPHGDSICHTNDQPNTKITYTVVVVENISPSSSLPPSTSITSISTEPPTANIASTDPPPSEVFWVVIPAVLVPIVVVILLLVVCCCYCHCKKKSKDDSTEGIETNYSQFPDTQYQCYVRVEPALRMECSASPPTASLSSCESGSKIDVNESEEISSLHFEGNLEDVPSDRV